MITVNDKNFKEEVLDATNLVVVDFWGPWCGPCRLMMPIISALETANSNVHFCKVNLDDNLPLAVEYGVDHIPTLLFFKAGQVVGKLVGLRGEPEIQKIIDANL